ncbi:MFS transporter [Streptomyces sp. NBC_01465]|uniref:MFS transporter n=1 Tax=Streptomyces sp. NBC_01465 TaxID=2903878 RepID=UPI002E35D45D|nr:MFS transporter [Streptomyces sp. NBC_01465]
MTSLTLVTSLRNPRFRLLFGGQAVSSIGDWLDYLALVVLITYTWEYGAGALAALSVAVAVPLVVLAPFAGVLADRMAHRAPVLIGCDLARSGLVLGYLVAPDLPVLLALVLAKTACGALFNPVHQSVLRSVVPEGDMLSAMSVSVFAHQAAKVAGPALSGLIVAAWGVRAAFLVDAATFLVSALLIALVRLPARTPAVGRQDADEGRPGGFRQEFKEGLAHVLRTPALVAVTVSMAATLFLVLTFDTLSPLAMRELGVAQSSLGYVVAAVGLGAALGTLAISQWGMRPGPFAVLALAQAAVGAMVCVMGVGLSADLQGAVWLWMVVGFVVGFGAAGIMVVFPYVLQQETPQELIGRVSATANAFPVLLQLAAPPLGAALAAQLGVASVFLGSGCALAVLGVAVWWYGRRGRADPVPDPEGPEDSYAGTVQRPEVEVHMADEPEPEHGGPEWPESGSGGRRQHFFW